MWYDAGMNADVVFQPRRDSRTYVRRVLLIATGFFVFVQLAFLEGLRARAAFALVFVVFLLSGLWISRRSRRSWPQEILMNREGIRYGDLAARHGVDLVPWREIARLDLFRTEHNMAPFLRIGLRPGAFRDRLRRPRAQRWSLASTSTSRWTWMRNRRPCWKRRGVSGRKLARPASCRNDRPLTVPATAVFGSHRRVMSGER